MKKYFAEMIGTMVLVLMGCGSAIFNNGVGSAAQVLMISFAFGLSVVAMAYTIGGTSGCHINPAITLGCFASGRISGKDTILYMFFQVLGAIIGSSILYIMVQVAGEDFQSATYTGANGIQAGQTAISAFVAEVVFTFVFVLVVLGTTSAQKGAGNLAGLAIGLTLVLVHIVCIPITGTSVNPARSVGPALFEAVNGSMEAIKHLWIFIFAPLVGALLSAFVWKLVSCDQ